MLVIEVDKKEFLSHEVKTRLIIVFFILFNFSSIYFANSFNLHDNFLFKMSLTISFFVSVNFFLFKTFIEQKDIMNKKIKDIMIGTGEFDFINVKNNNIFIAKKDKLESYIFIKKEKDLLYFDDYNSFL